MESSSNTTGDLFDSDIVSKYKAAGDVCNDVMVSMTEFIRVGVRIFEACEFGDREIELRLSRVFTKGNFKKGVAYPTSIAVNNCVCNFSPCREDESCIQEGDIVKVDLSCHVDGCVAVLAHTIIVGVESTESQMIANPLIPATFNFANAIKREMNPRRCLSEILKSSATLQQNCAYQIMEESGIYQAHRFKINGNKVLQLKQSLEALDEIQGVVEPFKVYIVDVMLSTGDGKVSFFFCLVHFQNSRYFHFLFVLNLIIGFKS
eukprot:TRINITY_DN6639_c0_g1_i3.p1 TRINITY_DN6639_c0_g1~~TRINITY_DN6639_c0_g1_i3.p1  ORF type:complete len:262 (+),score=42.03 TRINITY_DN6639_c0_g1_i3:109-894(+)